MDTRKLKIDNSNAPAHTVKDATCFDDINGSRLQIGDAAELVRRWNNYPALVEALEGLLKATCKAKEWAEVQPQFADDDGHFVGEWIDEARALLATLKQ
jgi:hypothetical protein